MSEFTCPICKQQGKHQSWYDDDVHMTVEAWDICGQCGYRCGFSYYQTEMVIESQMFGYVLSDPKRYQDRQWKLFKRACRHARRKYVRGYRMEKATT